MGRHIIAPSRKALASDFISLEITFMKKAMSLILSLVVSIGFALSLASSALAGSGPAVVTIGDFNGDGRADIMVSGGDGNGGSALWVFITNSAGNGPDSPNSGAIAFVPAGYVAKGAADFNGDDNADTLVQLMDGGANNGLLYVFLTDPASGTGGTPLSSSGGGNPGSVPTGFSVVGIGDADGDGKADVYVQDATGLLWVYITAADGISFNNGASGTPVTVPAGWTIVSVGDYNGDERSDVVVQNDATGQLYTWITAAGGITFDNGASGSVVGVPAGWNWSGGGEFTSGTATSSDLTVQNGAGGIVYVFATNADGVSLDAGASAMNVGDTSGTTPLTVQGIADFNGDEIADTLVINPADGFIYVFLNTGPGASSNVASLAQATGGFSVPVNPGF